MRGSMASRTQASARVNRQPRIKRRIFKRFGGCGSNLSQQQRPRDGKNAISGSWSRRRDLRLWRRASSEQGEFRGRPPLANATLSPPAPPLPTNLLLRKIFAGSLSSAHRAVQFAPIRYVSEQFARKPLALRSRLHPQIPSMFVTTKKRADTNRLSFPCLCCTK